MRSLECADSQPDLQFFLAKKLISNGFVHFIIQSKVALRSFLSIFSEFC